MLQQQVITVHRCLTICNNVSAFVPLGALTLLVERQEGHPACTELGVGMLMVMISLELHMRYGSSRHHSFHNPGLLGSNRLP